MTKKRLLKLVEPLLEDDDIKLVVGQVDDDDAEIDEGDHFEIFENGELKMLGYVLYIRKV